MKISAALDEIMNVYDLYAVTNAFRDKVVIRSIGRFKSDKRVTVEFKDIPILEAIETIFKESGVNYGIAPEVKGTATLKLIDVNFSDAVAALRRTNDLIIKESNGICIFAPKTPVSTIRPLFFTSSIKAS